ncbi:thioredoxin-like domain-containing protein [Saccharicrinis sp. FJH54]|uniref:thioredoxin-like domain-containing protein n=1 Tax=Saccharicrinis sp. FJH54 TaxID=3344665 RepID=UPI0035D3F44E
MKRILPLLFIVLISFPVFAQVVVNDPVVGLSTVKDLSVRKITLTKDSTVIDFSFQTYKGRGWYAIPRKTYIQPVGSDEKLFLINSIGIEVSKQNTQDKTEKVTYSLVFPALDKSVKAFDYGEANESGGWFIYDIRLEDRKNVFPLPEALYGEWFDSESHLWNIGFYNNIVIYKSKVWDYGPLNLKKKKGELVLKGKDDSELKIFYRLTKEGLYIGESNVLVRENVLAEKRQPTDNKPFDEPLFKIDTVTYSGVILNYTPRIGIRTFMIYHNNVILGDQISYTVTIQEDGTFSKKIPVYCPTELMLSNSFAKENRKIFIEPGKSLFHAFGTASDKAKYMGELARVNSDIDLFHDVHGWNYYEMRDTILKITPEEYKIYAQNAWNKDLNNFEDVVRENNTCLKANMIEKRDIDQSYLGIMIFYDNNYESAYREKNNIPRSQRQLNLDNFPLPAGYFDFLTYEILNDKFGPMTFEYYFFINRVMYCDLIPKKIIYMNYMDCVDDFIEDGQTLTANEKEIIEFLKKRKKVYDLPEVKSFMNILPKEWQGLLDNFKDSGFDFKNEQLDISSINKAVSDQGISLNEEDQKLLDVYKSYIACKAVHKINTFFQENRDSVQKFENKLKAYSDYYYIRDRNQHRNEALKDSLGIEYGLVNDIMYAQDILGDVVSQMTPLSERNLKRVQRDIQNDFISEYIAYANVATIKKIQDQKNKSGFVVNDVPETEGDKLFEAIMKKYRGKAVYVDFWATWCGPCRSGIERIKPLKEEMDTSKVAFVYITGPSSPENKWNNMIPDIKGEHYRVSKDEWNYLCGKFEISGIPHYVFVGKDGEVINPHLPHLQNTQIKALIEKETE